MPALVITTVPLDMTVYEHMSAGLAHSADGARVEVIELRNAIVGGQR
jgi:hypothetical protein